MLRKITALVLVAMLLLLSSALAETFDLSSLSDEDLLALREQVIAEIAARHLEDAGVFGQWYDFGLGQFLPSPSEVFGRIPKQHSTITNNDDKWFTDNLDEVTHEEFEAYVAALRAYGFNEKISASGISFEADNLDGIHISISLIGKVLFVDAKVKK